MSVRRFSYLLYLLYIFTNQNFDNTGNTDNTDNTFITDRLDDCLDARGDRNAGADVDTAAATAAAAATDVATKTVAEMNRNDRANTFLIFIDPVTITQFKFKFKIVTFFQIFTMFTFHACIATKVNTRNSSRVFNTF